MDKAMMKRMRKVSKRFTRKLSRGVTLIEVLIVVTIMAVIAGGATLLLFPKLKEGRVKSAYSGANVIKTAADAYKHLSTDASDACPTLQDLISAKQIDGNKTDDPWGKPYVIKCDESGDIRVISAGDDKKEGTPDDIRDNMKPSEVDKIAKM